MIDKDRNDFAALLKASMDIYQQEVSADALRIWWGALGKFEFSQVKEAFGRHIQDAKSGKYVPKPADIIGLLEAMNPDGRLGAEEAWALYPHDEASSAVISDEMAEAMGCASALMSEGDMIGARMAFKEAYIRITTKNKFNGISPKWFPSLGHSKEGREQALKQAAALGRISQDHVKALLPPPDNSAIEKMVELKLIA